LYDSSGTGTAASIAATSSTSTSTALDVTQNGIGPGMSINVNPAGGPGRGIVVNVAGSGAGVFASTAGGNGVWGITFRSSPAGVLGYNTDGEAVVGRSRGGVSAGAVVGRNDNLGPGVRGLNASNGAGGRFQTINPGDLTNTGDALEADLAGSGNSLCVNYHGGASSTMGRNMAIFANNGVNKARIDNNGNGYFNGGAQLSGADVAEAFAVIGDPAANDPSDVPVVSPAADRTLEKSAAPYAGTVAGVYSTRPGTLLAERASDADHSDLAPLGVIGVIPTRVTAGNGPIQRGDLVVTSSTPGQAMKAGPNPPTGSVLGKALAAFDGKGTGLIRVLVGVG
jgi:hypothetical protein